MIALLPQLRVPPPRPIFDLFSIRENPRQIGGIGVGDLFVWDPAIQPGYIQTKFKFLDFQMPVTLSKI